MSSWEEIRKGFKFGYEERYYKSLRFIFFDTVNECILHEHVHPNANWSTSKEILLALELFIWQCREMLY